MEELLWLEETFWFVGSLRWGIHLIEKSHIGICLAVLLSSCFATFTAAPTFPFALCSRADCTVIKLPHFSKIRKCLAGKLWVIVAYYRLWTARICGEVAFELGSHKRCGRGGTFVDVNSKKLL